MKKVAILCVLAACAAAGSFLACSSSSNTNNGSDAGKDGSSSGGSGSSSGGSGGSSGCSSSGGSSSGGNGMCMLGSNTMPIPDAGASDSASDSKGTCVESNPPPQCAVDMLESCCTCAAHCVPAAMLPNMGAGFGSYAAPCSNGGFCLPDKLITTGGATPAACTISTGGAGVCLGKCLAAVNAQLSTLMLVQSQSGSAACTSDEVCVPCVNPLSQASTGACKIGAGGACM
jgi:hypothetical protein